MICKSAKQKCFCLPVYHSKWQKQAQHFKLFYDKCFYFIILLYFYGLLLYCVSRIFVTGGVKLSRKLLITDHTLPGIGGQVDGPAYTILLLNYLPRLSPDTVKDMQRHTETDESFILLTGRAVLFTSDGKDAPDTLEATVLESGKIYTVPRNMWHTQVMTEDAKILLVENSGTVVENSPRHPLTESQSAFIFEYGSRLL